MKDKMMRLAALGLMAALLLTACNLPITPTPHPVPTDTPQPAQPVATPAAVGQACVIGSWQVNDLGQYLQSVLPQMIEGATITVGDLSGNLTYTFNADGTTAGTANDFKIKATVTTNGVSLPGQIQVSGTSTGKYQADDSQGLLTLTDIAPGDLAVTATVAGIPVVSKAPLTSMFMLGSSETGYGSANYECIGNSLKISVDVQNLGPRVIVLQRVS